MFRLVASPYKTFNILSAYTGEVLYTTGIKYWAEQMVEKMGLEYHIKEIKNNGNDIDIWVWDPENNPMFN